MTYFDVILLTTVWEYAKYLRRNCRLPERDLNLGPAELQLSNQPTLSYHLVLCFEK
jgi:hypothetical protein